ncbi:MAG: hypothetical protein NZX77_20210, partial [Polyangiaceae bacterium]|nr:hypothetical protein [Polyangiaceae bacterium]
MHSSLLSFFLVATLSSLAGCVVQQADSRTAGSGGFGQASAGQAGASGGNDVGQGGSVIAGSGGGNAGSSGSTGNGETDLCKGVPTTGQCKDATTIAACLIPDSQYEQPKVVEKKCPEGWTCQLGIPLLPLPGCGEEQKASGQSSPTRGASGKVGAGRSTAGKGRSAGSSSNFPSGSTRRAAGIVRSYAPRAKCLGTLGFARKVRMASRT